MQNAKLFALLVGINTYVNKGFDFKDLQGCLEDVKRMKEYLKKPFVQEKYAVEPILTILRNEQATKAAIIQAFEDDLSKAEEGDNILFYFSGHGVRETTNIHTFKEDEFDGNISALVCHESNPIKHQDPQYAGLSDKELRFLIHQLEKKTGAHIVCIFDCCHSGENTRSFKQQKQTDTHFRQIDRDPLKERAKAGFYFGEKSTELFAALDAGKNLKTILPEGKHIQLSACREVELAIETSSHEAGYHGVFTAALLDVLTQAKGSISYDELYLRVLNRMPTYTQSDDAQTPQMYINTGEGHTRYQHFLTQEASDKKLSCHVVAGGKEHEEKEWKATAGALQGIPIDKNKLASKLTVRSAKNDTDEWSAKIDQVFPGYCKLSFPDTAPPLDDATLYTEFEEMGTEPLRIFVGGPDQEAVALTRKILQQELDKAETKYYELIEEEAAAQYTLYAEAGNLLLTNPFVHDKALIQGIDLQDAAGVFVPDKVKLAHQDLSQVANWNFLKKLEYTEEHDFSDQLSRDITMFPIELRMFIYDEAEGKEYRKYPDKRSTFTFDFTPEENSRLFRLELVNHSGTDYFCSFLYLTNLFKVSAKMMTSPMMLLGPDQQVLSSAGNIIRGNRKYIKMGLKNQAYVRLFDWPGISYFFKVIVSKTPFEVEKLQMEALPKPVLFDSPRGKAKSTFDIEDSEEYDPAIPDVQWEIHTFELYMVNPELPDTN